MSVCKKCKNEIPDGSIFCIYCGERQIKTRKKRKSVTVPEPELLPSGAYRIQLRKEGISITRPDRDSCIADAISARKNWNEDDAKGLHTSESEFTLKEAIDAYILSRKNRLRNRSIAQYEYIRDNRFQVLMPIRISSITSDDIDAAVEEEMKKTTRAGKPISAKTVIDAYALVATVLRKYVRDIEIDVDLPEIQRSFPFVFPPEEIYPAIKGTDIELPCLLSMWLSLSMSEIRGLTKSKSVRGNKLYIVETVVDVNSVPERVSGGKEVTRPRVLDIPPYIFSLINAVEGDIIEPRSSHAIYCRFQVELKRHGLPHMRFHDLRHVNASVMADENIPTSVAQERGGWKTDSTMKKVYTHTFTLSRLEADKRINERFEKMLENS